MTFNELRDQIIANVNATVLNSLNCSEAIWALRDIDEEHEYLREYVEGIINACATGKIFDLTANKYVVER